MPDNKRGYDSLRMVKIGLFEEFDAIKKRIKQREKVIGAWPNMKQTDKTRIQQDMQKDHQAVLLQEAQATGQERQQVLELRREIEEQEKRFQLVDNIAFQKRVKKLIPKPQIVKNTILAFLVGGAICAVGQIIYDLFTGSGLIKNEASAATSATLVFGGAFFTGLGIYDKLGKFAGAGSIVPITGFANSVAASALEFKREGFIYGVGARLFTVAGPVIVYGTVVSIFIGLIYYFMR